MMDLNDVALFVQVVRAGSFAEAARQLGIPSNSVSRRIQELERRMGVALILRSTRKLVPTDVGRTLYERCAEPIGTLIEASQELADGSELTLGTLRVAAPADFFNWFLMDWIAEFLATHPQIRIEFVLSDARADLLGDGIDLALRGGKIHEPDLVARKIGTTRFVLVASPVYLAARGVPSTLKDLERHDCITAPSQAGRSSWSLDGPTGPVVVNVEGRFSANIAQVMLNASLANLGVALLPTIISTPHLRSGRLQEVLPAYGLDGLCIHLVYVRRKYLPRAFSAFINFMIAKVQAHGLI